MKQEILQSIDKVLRSNDPYALKLSEISQSLDQYADWKIKECLPEKEKSDYTRGDLNDNCGEWYDLGMINGFNDCIDQILLNKDKIK